VVFPTRIFAFSETDLTQDLNKLDVPRLNMYGNDDMKSPNESLRLTKPNGAERRATGLARLEQATKTLTKGDHI